MELINDVDSRIDMAKLSRRRQTGAMKRQTEFSSCTRLIVGWKSRGNKYTVLKVNPHQQPTSGACTL